jgi:hypothetical protein
MKSIWHIAICIIIIIPVIYFPYSGDLWIYVTGGQVLAEGGKIFKDFVDLKPPFLFMIFSVIYSIFGNSEINVRFAEFLIQSGIIISLYYLMRKVFDSANLAFYGTFFYALSYGALTHSNSFQSESLLPLFIIPLIYLRLKSSSTTNLILQGILIGLSGGLKYTFLAVYGGIFIAELFADKRAKQFFKEQILVIVGIILGFSLTFVLLLDSDIRAGFWDVQKFTYFYAQLPKIDFAFFKLAHEKITLFFGNHLSLLFVSIIVLGLFKKFDFKNKDKNPNQKQILNMLIMMSILLLISVFIEKKFAINHFSRLFITFSFLFAIGADSLLIAFKDFLEKINIKKLLLILLISPFIIIFSPLPRYLTVLSPIPNYYLNTSKYNEHYNKPETHLVMLTKLKEISEVVNQLKNENDKIMVMSLGCQTLNYYLDNKNILKFPLPLFPLSGVSKLWLEEYIVEIEDSDILVVQTDDSHPSVSGYVESTWQKINQQENIRLILEKGFEIVFNNDSFYVLRRTI